MTEAEQQMTGFFFFDPEDPIYRDHFPGQPVVPGSLIIHAFVEASGRPVKGETPIIASRFRFKKFLSPGRYAFRIRSRPDGRADCMLIDNDETLVTGIL